MQILASFRRALVLGIALSIMTGCGAWVLRYEKEASLNVSIPIDAAKNKTLIDKLRHFADANLFQFDVVEHGSDSSKFSLFLRRPDMYIAATNFPVDTLSVTIHRARGKAGRFPEEHLKNIVDQFSEAVQESQSTISD